MPRSPSKNVIVAAVLILVVVGVLVLVICGGGMARAADGGAGAAEPANEWRQWRGPHFNGSSDAKRLPDKLDEKANARWTTAMPGTGSGTPVVAGDRVFVSALDKASQKLLAMC